MHYHCVFCDIIQRDAPARIEYEDDDVIVFHNVLDWADVMLMAVPKQHQMQGELWTSEIMTKVSRAAVEQGERHCPKGFRLVSNFGHDAMQSQAHAHIHVVDARYLHPYPRRPGRVHWEDNDVVVVRNEVQREPVTLIASARAGLSQGELWRSDALPKVARVAAEMGEKHCPGGFRMLSDFGPAEEHARAAGYVHIIGGTRLGEYA